MTEHDHRINARLDESSARKLAYLRQTTDQTTTQVIRTAIDRYYEAQRAQPSSALSLLEDAGLVGCGEAESSLSESYKDELSALLSAKLAATDAAMPAAAELARRGRVRGSRSKQGRRGR